MRELHSAGGGVASLQPGGIRRRQGLDGRGADRAEQGRGGAAAGSAGDGGAVAA